MKKIDLLYFDAGGGHRSAANALKEVIERQHQPWRIELVNLQEAMDELDLFRKLLGIRLEDCYNLVLNKGWTLGSAQLIARHAVSDPALASRAGAGAGKAMAGAAAGFAGLAGPELEPRHRGERPQSDSRDAAGYDPDRHRRLSAAFLDRAPETISDLRIGPRRRTGAGTGAQDAFIFKTSGMILNPRFYEPLEIDRAAERRKLGLDPERQTGLVMFGGQGSNVMMEIARALDTQLICICGKNENLAARLRELSRPSPMFVEGFTKQVPYYMRLADFFIGKPGPGSLSEALAMKLPVIVERNAWTLPQERYNAEWITKKQVGIVLPNFRGIAAAVAELLEPGNYARYKAGAEAENNRAVFEIPDILEKILESS